MTDLKEPRARARVCVKFCFPSRKTEVETHNAQERLLRINPWVKHKCTRGLIVSKEEMSVEDQPRCGRPSSRTDENVEKVHAILADRLRTIDEISEITGVSCQRILTEDLMIERVAAKFVICRKSSKLTLSFSQKL
jgi:hypothetical protein